MYSIYVNLGKSDGYFTEYEDIHGDLEDAKIYDSIDKARRDFGYVWDVCITKGENYAILVVVDAESGQKEYFAREYTF